MTREEAMKSIQEILGEATEEYSVCYVTSYDAEALQMAIEALKAQEWIQCSERLPLVGDTYIVTVEDKYGRHVDAADSHGDYIDGYWNTFNDWYEGQEVHVIAWMEKPKPYKAESEE